MSACTCKFTTTPHTTFTILFSKSKLYTLDDSARTDKWVPGLSENSYNSTPIHSHPNRTQLWMQRCVSHLLFHILLYTSSGYHVQPIKYRNLISLIPSLPHPHFYHCHKQWKLGVWEAGNEASTVVGVNNVPPCACASKGVWHFYLLCS